MADNLRKFTTQEVLNKVYSDSSGNSIGINAATSKETLNAALDTSNSRLNVSLAGGTISGDVTINGDLTVNGDGVGAYDEIISGGLVINVTDGQNVKGLHITQLDAGEWTSMMEAVAYGLLVRSTANDTTPAFKVQGNGTSNEVLSALSNGNVGIGTASPDHNLDIVSSGNAEFELTRTSGASIFMQSQSAKGLIGTSSNHSLNFLTNGGTRLTIDTSGNLTVSSGSAIQFGDSSYKIIGSTVGNYLRFFTESTQALQIDDSQNATFSGNVKITKAESSASEFISALEINRDYGSATATDLLTGMIFTDDNSVQAGIFTNRYNSAGSYNSRLQFYVNNSSSSMTPQTALGDPALIIDESKNATFAGRVAILSDFTGGELLGVKGSVGSDWGARIENTSSTGAGALIKSATTNAGVQLFQVRSGSDNVFTIMGDQNATFAGNVTVNGSTTTPMTISADTDKVFTLSSGIGETDNVPTIQTINTAGSALVGFGVRASVINLVTGSAKRLVLDDNSRISLSNNDSGTSNTVFGKLAGDDLASGGNYNSLFGDNTGGNTTGDYNVAIGMQALKSLPDGDKNVAIGVNAMEAQDDTANGLNDCVAIGFEAFQGTNAGTSAPSGTVAIGSQSLKALTSGASNTAVGYTSLDACSTGYDNTALGYNSLGVVLQTGNNNVAIGKNSLDASDNGARNVAIGNGANGTQVTTYDCVTVGHEAEVSGNNASNQIVIGQGATGRADNSVTLGNTATTQVYVAPHASNGGATQQLVFRDDADKGIINYDHNNGMFKITVEGTEHSRFASGGDLVLLHGGVNFLDAEGTSASSDANTLDDYEEGLHTPSITGSSSGNFVLNTSFDTASYTKIGRQVTYTGEIRIASDNGTSGEIRFSLPFDSIDLTETAGKSVSTNVHLSGHGDASIDDNKLIIYIEENSSFFRIGHVADDDTFAYLTHANVDGTWNLAFTLTYFTS